MVSFGAIIVGLIIQTLIGSLIAAIILRAACALYNKWFAKKEFVAANQSAPQPVSKPRVSPVQSDSPYAPPMAPLRQANEGKVSYTNGVDEPTFGKAFVICLLASLVNFGVAFGVGVIVALAFRGEALYFATTVAQLASVVFGFLILATAFKLGLPTSFPRALAVAGIFMLIGLMVALAIGLVVFTATSLLA